MGPSPQPPPPAPTKRIVAVLHSSLQSMWCPKVCSTIAFFALLREMQLKAKSWHKPLGTFLPLWE